MAWPPQYLALAAVQGALSCSFGGAEPFLILSPCDDGPVLSAWPGTTALPWPRDRASTAWPGTRPFFRHRTGRLSTPDGAGAAPAGAEGPLQGT